MIPKYAKVIAIDDNQDHLQKVAWGLGRAGLSAIPFLFEDGRLESPPEEPIPGVRVVFTDIHLVEGGPNNEKIHAANIIRCLKRLVAHGPYVLVFWSQFPDDGTGIMGIIEKNAPDSGLTPPIGYGSIDKNLVFDVAPAAGEDDDFKPDELRDRILDCLKPFKTLAVAMSWEDRAGRAAAKTTDRIYALTEKCPRRLATWERLLAFLACEAVGKEQAVKDLQAGINAALLPILEDQLGSIDVDLSEPDGDLEPLLAIVAAEGRRRCPAKISTPDLNASHLIDESGMHRHPKMWDRGMVMELGGAFINSGEFIRAFGLEKSELIAKEFLWDPLRPDDGFKVKLHLVSLDAECDHVQNKVSTRRYLLALLVPVSLIEACKNKETGRFRNESIVDTGCLALRSHVDEPVHLLISTKSIMTLAAGKSVDGTCRFRLRRLLLEEVMHRYTSHVRRPGVPRFYP